MPAKTPTKRPAPKSKQSFLKRVISLNTKKGQFIAFILVFALLGGGYYAYRSFAAKSAAVYTIEVKGLPRGTRVGFTGHVHDIGYCRKNFYTVAGQPTVIYDSSGQYNYSQTFGRVHCYSGRVGNTQEYHPVGSSDGRTYVTYPTTVRGSDGKTYRIKSSTWKNRSVTANGSLYFYVPSGTSGLHVLTYGL